jgi:hypothetical protein
VCPPGAEKQVNAFKAAIADEKRKNGQLGTLNAMANEKANALEAALAAEQNKAADLGGKITFYGDAYKKLQGKLTGRLGPSTVFVSPRSNMESWLNLLT